MLHFIYSYAEYCGAGCMPYMHFLRSLAKLPNSELKTRPNQLQTCPPIVLALPALTTPLSL
jgi:hypothetical protein